MSGTQKKKQEGRPMGSFLLFFRRWDPLIKLILFPLVLTNFICFAITTE